MNITHSENGWVAAGLKLTLVVHGKFLALEGLVGGDSSDSNDNGSNGCDAEGELHDEVGWGLWFAKVEVCEVGVVDGGRRFWC